VLKIFKSLFKLSFLFIIATLGDFPFQSLVFNLGLSSLIVLLPTRIQSSSALSLCDTCLEYLFETHIGLFMLLLLGAINPSAD